MGKRKRKNGHSPRAQEAIAEAKRRGVPVWVVYKEQCAAKHAAENGDAPTTKFAIDPYYDTPEWRNLREIVLIRDGKVCQYCGERGHQADHVIPRKKGGPDDVKNLVCACRACNKVAGNHAFESFERKKAWVLAARGKTLAAPEKPEPPPKRRERRGYQVAPPPKRSRLVERLVAKKLAEGESLPDEVHYADLVRGMRENCSRM